MTEKKAISVIAKVLNVEERKVNIVSQKGNTFAIQFGDLLVKEFHFSRKGEFMFYELRPVTKKEKRLYLY